MKMSLERMTIDEYAKLARGNGARLFKVNGIWWRKVGLFFYRPLFPFVRIDPKSIKAPTASFLGGYQHLVQDSCTYNSHMNFLVFDNIHTYSIKNISCNYRKNIKRASKNLIVRKIDNLEELATAGYRIYMSFYNRTGYFWRRDRTDRKVFTRWAQNIFTFPKIMILGAYHNGELTAVGISYLVEDIIMYDTFFCDTTSLKLRAPELMLHIIREMASQCLDAKYLYMGLPGRKKSIDDFKISRGCRIIAEPAYFKVNPVALLLTKRFRKEDYKKLIGMDQEKVDEIMKTIIVINGNNLSFKNY